MLKYVEFCLIRYVWKMYVKLIYYVFILVVGIYMNVFNGVEF